MDEKFKTVSQSVFQFSHSVMSDSLQAPGLQHARLPCPSPTPRVHSNSCPRISQWYHPTISSSVIPFSSHCQSFPASGSFPMSQFFTSGGQSFGVSASASVLPMNIQDWFPLEWIGQIFLQCLHNSVYTTYMVYFTKMPLKDSPFLFYQPGNFGIQNCPIGSSQTRFGQSYRCKPSNNALKERDP